MEFLWHIKKNHKIKDTLEDFHTNEKGITTSQHFVIDNNYSNHKQMNNFKRTCEVLP